MAFILFQSICETKKNPIKESDRQKKWQTEYRTATTIYPCFLPNLGEFNRSWSYQFAVANVENKIKSKKGLE